MQHPPKKMPKSGKKRTWVIAALLALVLAAAFVLVLPLIRQAFPGQKLNYDIVENTVRTIALREAAQMERVVIYPDGQSSYTLYMRDGKLYLDKDGSLTAIAEDYQTEILKVLTEISVQNTVTEDATEVAEHLQAMGLEAPQCKAEVFYTDGTAETYEVGALIHDGTDYYFRWSGAEGIYTCHSGVPEAFTVAPNLLLPFEQPVIYASLIERIEVKNANGECVMLFDEDGFGSIAAPAAYPMTDEMAQTMATAAENVRLGAYEAELTAENSAEYGFDAPLCTLRIVLREGVTSVVGEDGTFGTQTMPAQDLTFVIGREEGEFFYTCAYRDHVYLVSKFLLKTLAQADVRTLISRTPAAMGQDLLTRIVFEVPDKTVDVGIARTESVLANNELELDAEGNIVYLTDVTVNGQPAPQELLDELLKRLNGFTVEGDIPAGAQVSEEPSWRVTLCAESGSVRVIEGYQLDVFSDAVAVNGQMYHYVYNEAIDVLMSVFQ